MAPQFWTLDTEEKRKNFNAHVSQLVLAGKPPTVQFVEHNRSSAQNNSMWLWAEQCAMYLNECGLDQRKVLKEDAPIPWTKTAFVDRIWRPVQEAMNGSESTRDAKKLEVSEIYETITRHIATSQGVTLPPFPSREGV